jgi:hypothetical protein
MKNTTYFSHQAFFTLLIGIKKELACVKEK